MAAEVFSVLFGTDDLSIVPLQYFVEFRKFCAVEAHASDFIERIDAAALKRFSLGVLESVLKLLDDFDDLDFFDETAVRRAKILMQTFVNMCNKSLRFRGTIAHHSVTHWMGLLRLEPVRVEVLASLVCLIRDMHKVFYSEETYTQLLSDLATLWNQVASPNDQKSWISALFAILLEEDHNFLSECRVLMDRESFADVLFITESLIEHSNEAKLPVVHPNNILFCVNYFEQLDRDLSMLNDYSPMPNLDVGIRFYLLTDIIAGGAQNRPCYDEILHKSSKAVRLICGVLRVLLEVEDFRRQELEAALMKRAQAMKQQAAASSSSTETAGRNGDEGQSETRRQTRRRTQKESEEKCIEKEEAGIRSDEEGGDAKRPPYDPLSPSEVENGVDHPTKEEEDDIKSEDGEKKSNGEDNESHPKDNKEVCDTPLGTLSTETNEENEPNSKSGPTSPKQARWRQSGNHPTPGTDNGEANDLPQAKREGSTKECDENVQGSSRSNDCPAQQRPASLGIRCGVQLRRLLLIRHIPLHIAASLREASVRAIGNLCNDSADNRLVAGTEMDAVGLLLRCALKIEVESPLAIQWAILALKNLCNDCPENQERLLYVTEHPNSIFDRNRLLAAIGLRVAEMDEETGKVVRLEKIPFVPPSVFTTSSTQHQHQPMDLESTSSSSGGSSPGSSSPSLPFSPTLSPSSQKSGKPDDSMLVGQEEEEDEEASLHDQSEAALDPSSPTQAIDTSKNEEAEKSESDGLNNSSSMSIQFA